MTPSSQHQTSRVGQVFGVTSSALNANWFYSLGEAKSLIEDWITDYNEQRPHSALGGLTPREYE